MNAVFKNLYMKKLPKLVKEYNNTAHKMIKAEASLG